MRQKDILPLITGSNRHGNCVRLVSDEPIPDGSGADLPCFFLEAGLDYRKQKLLVQLDWYGHGHTGSGGRMIHHLLAFTR